MQYLLQLTLPCLLAAGVLTPMFAQAQYEDGLLAETRFTERQPLAYAPVREADIMWKTHVWRTLDTREKLNLPFRYPARPFFALLEEGVANGNLTAYRTSTFTDTEVLPATELNQLLHQRDTVTVVDPVTGEWALRAVANAFNAEDVILYYLHEVWYFDSKLSVLRPRVLALAPVKVIYDEAGEVRYHQPLFWIDYQQARAWLAKQPAFQEGNDQTAMSWEDKIEMRQFASYVTKTSNVHDQRLADYQSGPGLLLESARQEQAIFHYELDLWEH